MIFIIILIFGSRDTFHGLRIESYIFKYRQPLTEEIRVTELLYLRNVFIRTSDYYSI